MANNSVSEGFKMQLNGLQMVLGTLTKQAGDSFKNNLKTMSPEEIAKNAALINDINRKHAEMQVRIKDALK